MAWYDQYKVNVPEGRSGSWRVERFVVDKLDWFMTILRSGSRYIPEGIYTRLTWHGLVIMSDTPAEIRDHFDFIKLAQGDVLIHGLGLGMSLQAVASKEEVRSVLVIEKSQDVIDLVAPTYRERFPDKVEIRRGDAFTWKPEKGQRWDYIWHDVWGDMCVDNYEEMKRLHRRFGRRCNWQDSWGRAVTKKKIAADKRKEQRGLR